MNITSGTQQQNSKFFNSPLVSVLLESPTLVLRLVQDSWHDAGAPSHRPVEHRDSVLFMSGTIFHGMYLLKGCNLLPNLSPFHFDNLEGPRYQRLQTSKTMTPFVHIKYIFSVRHGAFRVQRIVKPKKGGEQRMRRRLSEDVTRKRSQGPVDGVFVEVPHSRKRNRAVPSANVLQGSVGKVFSASNCIGFGDLDASSSSVSERYRERWVGCSGIHRRNGL